MSHACYHYLLTACSVSGPQYCHLLFRCLASVGADMVRRGSGGCRIHLKAQSRRVCQNWGYLFRAPIRRTCYSLLGGLYSWVPLYHKPYPYFRKLQNLLLLRMSKFCQEPVLRKYMNRYIGLEFRVFTCIGAL